MSKLESHYWGEEIKRTLNEMKDLCGKKKRLFWMHLKTVTRHTP